MLIFDDIRGFSVIWGYVGLIIFNHEWAGTKKHVELYG